MQAFERLEYEFAKWNGLDPAGMVVCSSGSAALHLALEALQLPSGSRVICPDFTMIACPRAITLAGVEPVFVDCRDDLLIDPQLVDEATDSDVSMMAVHIYGRRCDMDYIAENFCGGMTGAWLIEDLAEAHGVKPHPYTDAAAWSFYKNKCVNGQEGGCVWFRDPKHAALARQLRSLGFTDDHDFMHIPRGCNYRMSNVHAELILRSLANVETNIQKRRVIEQWYDAACPDEWRMPKRNVVWVYDLRIPGMTSEQQTKIVKLLNGNGIQARFAFKPCHVQPEYKNCRHIGGEVAERMSREVIYLPINPNSTTLDQIERPFELIRSIVNYP